VTRPREPRGPAEPGEPGDGPRRRRRAGRDVGPRPLKDGLDEAVARLRGGSAHSGHSAHPAHSAGATAATLFSRWGEICGPAVAKHARPIRLTAGTLEVVVDHPAWATELRMQSSTILARVTEAAGETADRLVVRVRPGLWPDESERGGAVG